MYPPAPSVSRLYFTCSCLKCLLFLGPSFSSEPASPPDSAISLHVRLPWTHQNQSPVFQTCTLALLISLCAIWPVQRISPTATEENQNHPHLSVHPVCPNLLRLHQPNVKSYSCVHIECVSYLCNNNNNVLFLCNSNNLEQSRQSFAMSSYSCVWRKRNLIIAVAMMNTRGKNYICKYYLSRSW